MLKSHEADPLPSPGAAVFLDRDGVINRELGRHVCAIHDFEFMDGAIDALVRLGSSDFQIVVVTNQSGIGRGLVSELVVREIHTKMVEEVARHGGRIDAVYYCPHTPAFGCDCRKPRPGLLNRASMDHELSLESSFFVGDTVRDLLAGAEVSCTPILVTTGKGAREQLLLGAHGLNNVAVVDDLTAAVDLILATV